MQRKLFIVILNQIVLIFNLSLFHIKFNLIFLFLDIFLHRDFTVKIGDFGLATFKAHWMNDGKTMNQPTGSILWMAPEVIRMSMDNPYTFRSDVYGYGIVLFELATGRLPYADRDRDQILYMVGRGMLKPNLNLVREGIPKKFSTLIKSCIEFELEKRPLFDKVKNLTLFFLNLNFLFKFHLDIDHFG